MKKDAPVTSASNNKNKFSQKQFLPFVVNYIVGFGFVATISGVIGAGLWGILMFVLTTLITLAASLAYSRLGAAFQGEYGGSYLYAKRAFGRTMSFFQGWNQFIQGPILAATAPLFIADAIGSVYPGDDNVNLAISAASIAFFLLLVVISTFGIALNKKIIFATSAIKWIVLVLGVGLALYLCAVDSAYAQNLTGAKSPTPYLIFANVLSFMYAFGGMEDVAAMAADVKVKNFRKSLMIAFAVILSFYLFAYILLMGVSNPGGNTGIDTVYNLALGSTALIIFVIGVVFGGISAKISVAISQSRKIIPLAADGYLPRFITKKNRKGEYFAAMYFAAGLTILSMLIFWLLPRLLALQAFFGSVIQLGTVAFLIQYFLTLVSAFALMRKKKISPIP